MCETICRGLNMEIICITKLREIVYGSPSCCDKIFNDTSTSTMNFKNLKTKLKKDVETNNRRL